MCPPVREQVSMSSSRISAASVRSSSRESAFRSAVDSRRVRIDIGFCEALWESSYAEPGSLDRSIPQGAKSLTTDFHRWTQIIPGWEAPCARKFTKVFAKPHGYELPICVNL